MATVNLMASKPGAYTKEGLIEGNPDAVAYGVSPSASFGAANLTVTKGFKNRLLSITTDAQIEVIQVSDNETPATANGQVTRIPAPSSGITSYACLLHPATVGVYVRTA